jgi:hypothetical protein
MSDELFKEQINSLIRDEIQEIINDYVDLEEETKKSGLGFVPNDNDNDNEEKELKINISNNEIDKLLKQYKKIKKYKKSSLYIIKTMDGTETIISSLIKEAENNSLD